MTHYEILKANDSALKLYLKCDVRITDVYNLAMYEEYMKLKEEGNKSAYIEAVLAEKYECSYRKVRRVVARMKKDIKI